MTNETTTTAAASKKTLEERLLDAKAVVAKLEQQIATRNLINNVDKGDKVVFNYGRAEKKRSLTGIITAKKETEQGLQLKIVVGEDFDAEDYKVFARDITENLTKGTTAPADADEGQDDNDPLTAA